MTFDDWWEEIATNDPWVKALCKDAWDHQQRIIDETMYDLNHAEKACDRLQERIEQLTQGQG